MKITFLGTSSGLTESTRFYSNLLIKENNYQLLIDCGDGISKHLLNNNYSFKDDFDSIIITHFHADHIGGLPTLLTQMKLYKRTKSLKIYVHHTIISEFINLLNTFLLFPEKFPFPLQIFPIFEEADIFLNESLFFNAKINSHITLKDYKTYYNKHINPVSLSLKITSNKHSIIYTSDLGKAEDLKLFKVQDEKYFITECSHIDISEILKLTDNNNIKIVLCHYELNKLNSLLDNYKITKNIKENKLIIAEDNLTIID
jgi:ribonuclease BN (tRNA processing enzyme)